jgi:hypothetical protein
MNTSRLSSFEVQNHSVYKVENNILQTVLCAKIIKKSLEFAKLGHQSFKKNMLLK